MANKEANKKILRAISIGLATMMSVQPIMTTPVFADEDVEDNNKYSADEEHSSESADEARESVEAAETAAEAVETTVESVNPGEAGTTDGVDNAQAIIDAVSTDDIETSDDSDNTESETEKIKVSDVLEQASENLEVVDVKLTIAEAKAEVISGFNTTDGVDSEAKKANDATISAEAAISEETVANESIEAAVEKGNESVAEAVEKYNEGTNVVSEANNIVVEAEATYTELVNTVSEATTVEEAQKAYDDLDALITDTQVKVADKKVALDAAKEALSAIVDSVKEHEAEAEEARAAFEKAEEDYNAAKEAYNSGNEAYAKHVKEIKEFNEAYETAKKNLEAAESNLDIVSEKAAALTTAVANAQKALANSGASDRAKIVTNSMNSVANASESKNKNSYWIDMDKLFESMMRNYYLPEKLGVNAESAELATFDWNNKSKNIDELDKAFNDDYNFCIVKYIDAEGKEQTKYFNYKRELEVDGKTPNSIVIFEKRDVEVKANRLLNQGQDISDLDGVEAEAYYVNKKTYNSVDELIKAGIKEVEGAYYKVNAKNSTIDLITYDENKKVIAVNGEKVVNNDSIKTEVTVGSQNINYIMLDGMVAKKYVAPITTVVYEKNSVSSTQKFNSEDAARKAAVKLAGGEKRVANLYIKSTEEAGGKKTWSYNLDYWKEVSKTTESLVTKIEKYNSEKVKLIVNQNQNFADYKEGKENLAKSTLIQSSDSDFINFLGLEEKYNSLKGQAETEEEAVNEAKENVTALKKAVNDLRGKVPENTVPIGELPENTVKISEAKINSLIKTLSDLGVDFGGTNIEELTLDDIKDALKAEESKLEALENKVRDLKDSMDDVAIQLAETIERINNEAEENTTPSESQTESETPSNAETTPTTPTEAVTPDSTETTPIEEANTVDVADTSATLTEESTTASVTTPSTSSSESTVMSSPSYEATTSPSISVTPQADADIIAPPIAGADLDSDITALPVAEAEALVHQEVAGARVTQTGENSESSSEIAQDGVTSVRTDNLKEMSGDITKGKKSVTIKDDEVPLSSLTEDEAKKISWWWLLLIALLGATGEEMYRRHKNKKEEQ